MKKYTYLLLSFCVSCKNYLGTISLKYAGVYDDSEVLHTADYNNKKIVFVPMHHLGTESFYSDVKNKIDSLKKENYYFIYEQVSANKIDETFAKKLRKFLKTPLSTDGSYVNEYKTMFPNIKYEKPLIDQPSYKELGLSVENSERVDVDYKDLVDYYENKHGEIKLTDCDYKTSVYERYTKCKEGKKIPLHKRNDIIINFRNDFVVKYVKESPQEKIAIVYGAEHMKGILKGLKE